MTAKVGKEMNVRDIEAVDLRVERLAERYQRRYGIDYGNLAWILLRLGTVYYFRDLCVGHVNGQKPR